jgi:drug/metabolite transporter (DMT)-like permease
MVGRYACYGALAAGLMLPRLVPLLRRLRRADWLAMLRQALAGNVVYYLLLAYGVKLAGVAPTSLIIGLLPLSVTLSATRTTARRPAPPGLAAAGGGAGIACINIDIFSHAGGADGASPAHRLLGVLCAIGALACWTWYALDNDRFKRHAHVSAVEWSMLYGLASGVIALAVGAVALALHHAGPAAGAPARDWPRFWLVCLLLALGASVIGNYLWNLASRLVPDPVGPADPVRNPVRAAVWLPVRAAHAAPARVGGHAAADGGRAVVRACACAREGEGGDGRGAGVERRILPAILLLAVV